MSIFLSKNPFRVLGVLTNDSVRIIEKNISKFKAYAKLDKNVDSNYDFNFLNFQKINRDVSSLSKSQNILLIDNDKLKHSLFWFINHNTYDNIALENLLKGDVKKAMDIWRKCINNKSISKNNFSIYNNLSTLLFLIRLDDSKSDIFSKSKESKKDIKEAIKLKYELISSKYLINYKEALNVENSDLTVSRLKEFFSNTILNILKTNYDNSELVDLFNNLDDQISNSLSSNLIKDSIENIKANINSTNDSLEEDHKRGIDLGKKLIKSTFKDIKNIKDIVGVDNYEYQIITDQLANQIIQCGILYYNKTFDDQDYLSSYKYALSISFSEKTKKRAKDTIKHCKEEKGKNICSKCSKNNVDKSTPWSTILYKETSRNFWSNTVRYNQVTLTLYYCKSCSKKMSEEESSESTMTWVIAGIGFLVGAIGMESFWGGVFAGFISLGLGGFLAGLFFGSNRDTSDHPSVKKYLREGWSFNQPGQ